MKKKEEEEASADGSLEESGNRQKVTLSESS